MSEDDLDPAASTQVFQAFFDRQEPEASRSSWMWVAVAAFTALIVLVPVVLLLAG